MLNAKGKLKESKRGGETALLKDGRRSKQLVNIQHTVAMLDDAQMLNRYVYGSLSRFYLTL